MDDMTSVVLALLAAAFLFFVVWTLGSTKKKEKTSEGFYVPPPNFKVLNYFPSHAIKVTVLPKVGCDEFSPEKTLVERIEPLQSGGLYREQVIQYLRSNNILRFYVSKGDGTDAGWKHFSDYEIDTNDDSRIKALHVGMITTRFIGSTDGLRMSTVAANAIDGNAWLKIHNLSKLPLRLNDDIVVAPNSTVRYQGYMNMGVTLGFWFKDQDGLYPTFQYLSPQSDLYYGLVSDIRQNLSGCVQSEFNDVCEYGQTMWPFQENVM